MGEEPRDPRREVDEVLRLSANRAPPNRNQPKVLRLPTKMKTM